MSGPIEFLPQPDAEEPEPPPPRRPIPRLAWIGAVLVVAAALGVWIATRPADHTASTAAPSPSAHPSQSVPARMSATTCRTLSNPNATVVRAMRKHLRGIRVDATSGVECTRRTGMHQHTVSESASGAYRGMTVAVLVSARSRPHTEFPPEGGGDGLRPIFVLDTESAGVDVHITLFAAPGTSSPWATGVQDLADDLSLNLVL